MERGFSERRSRVFARIVDALGLEMGSLEEKPKDLKW
jgi:hypothetical protein